MQMGGVAGGIYKVCDWLMKLAILNLIWLLFVVMGLGLFGVFPATVAMLNVLKCWVRKEECKTFSYFASVYKQSFVKVNLLMIMTVAVGAVLMINVVIVQAMEGLLRVFVQYGMVFLLLLYSIVALYIMPVFSHRPQGVWATIKRAFVISFLHPVRTGVFVAGLGLIYLVIRSIPGMIPFYGASLIGMWTILMIMPILDEKEEKKDGQEQRERERDVKKDIWEVRNDTT
ncbi:YesL family protein [Halalkalibacter krulwichiae]|nr:YesL family protein [Halalkalibacter krulwichiae]